MYSIDFNAAANKAGIADVASAALPVADITGLGTVAAGVYNGVITYTDGNGCVGTDAFTITINVLPVPAASNNGPLCSGSNISLSGLPNGMITYSWSGPGGFSSTAQNPIISSALVSATGTYILTVTDANGCSASASTSVLVNNCCDANVSDITSVTFCEGEVGPFSFDVSAYGGIFGPAPTPIADYSYQIILTTESGVILGVDPTVYPVIETGGTIAPTLPYSTLLASGSPYYLYILEYRNVGGNTVINNAVGQNIAGIALSDGSSCYVVDYNLVNVLPNPVVTLGANQEICANITVVDLTTLEPTTQAGGVWSNAGGVLADATNADPTTGPFTYTYTAENGCVGTDIIDYIINALPVATLNNPIQCYGTASTTLNLTATAGTPTMYSIDFDVAANTAGIADVASAALPVADITGLGTVASGVYNGTITYSDANGCVGTDAFTITINALPTATISNTGATYCLGDPITSIFVDVTGTGPFTLNYTLNGVPMTASAAASPIILGNAVGTYILSNISDANCSIPASGMQEIVVINCCSINVSDIPNAEICIGTVGPLSFDIAAYSDATLVPPTAYGPTPSPAEDYSYQFMLTDDAAVILQIDPTQYAVDANGSTETPLFTYSGLAAGDYRVYILAYHSVGGITVNGDGIGQSAETDITLSDGSTCFETDFSTLTVHPLPVINISDQIVCESVLSVDMTALEPTTQAGGVWSNAGGVLGDATNADPATGPFTYTYTDANTCVGSDMVSYTFNDSPSAVISGDAIICEPATTSNVTISGTPGAFVELSNGVNVVIGATGSTVIPLSAGSTYTIVSVISDLGCVGTGVGSANIGAINCTTAGSIGNYVYVDENLNGQSDAGEGLGGVTVILSESYTDTNGNGVWDAGEPFVDNNGNGAFDSWTTLTSTGPNESFTDANGNGVWDDGDDFTDLNGDGVWNPGEPFVDLAGDGYTAPEPFIDSNGDGQWTGVGSYTFDGLPAGDYIITIVPPTGYTVIGPDTYAIELGSGQEFSLQYDFVLPTNITSMNAIAKCNEVLLQWNVGSENNMWEYIVQRSTDGIAWKTVGVIPAVGNIASTHTYSFNDGYINTSVAYYRIISKEVSSTLGISQVIVVYNDCTDNIVITSIYPNPIDNEIHLNITSSVTFNDVITITDELGRVIMQENIMINSGENKVVINVRHLAQAVYFIGIEGKTEYIKFTKIN